MDARAVLQRHERDLVRLCHAGYDSRRFRLEAQRRLRALIPTDAYFWATTDPATVLATTAVSAEIAEAAIPPLWANEFLDDDVNKFATLARGVQTVGHLYGVTGGEPDRSARHREIFAPLGLGDELRAALTVGGQCWGILCLNRARGGSPYTAEDAARLTRLAPHLAEGLRTALLLDHVDAIPATEGPGLIVLAEDLGVVATTAAAERWLAELQDWPRRRDLPNAVLVLAARLRALEQEGGSDLLPRVRVRTPSGQWLLLHASRLAGAGGSGSIAIITEVARPAAIAPLILQAYGLTEREAQIAGLVLRGAATREIAAPLAVAAATVQQHLKAIFDKTGVRSRRELVAQIFGQHYAPGLVAGVEVGPDHRVVASRRESAAADGDRPVPSKFRAIDAAPCDGWPGRVVAEGVAADDGFPGSRLSRDAGRSRHALTRSSRCHRAGDEQAYPRQPPARQEHRQRHLAPRTEVGGCFDRRCQQGQPFGRVDARSVDRVEREGVRP